MNLISLHFCLKMVIFHCGFSMKLSSHFCGDVMNTIVKKKTVTFSSFVLVCLKSTGRNQTHPSDMVSWKFVYSPFKYLYLDSILCPRLQVLFFIILLHVILMTVLNIILVHWYINYAQILNEKSVFSPATVVFEK